MNVRQWLGGLSERERGLVYIAGGVVAVALLFVVLVLPLRTMEHRFAARVDRKSADLAWMRQVAPQVAAAAARGPVQGAGESLVVLVDRTAREAGLGASLRDQSPEGNQGVRLRLEAASFDTLMTWLASLQQQYGVRIDSAIFGATAPGIVNASVSLSRPGPG
jgi:type II secretory pathway component PulM